MRLALRMAFRGVLQRVHGVASGVVAAVHRAFISEKETLSEEMCAGSPLRPKPQFSAHFLYIARSAPSRNSQSDGPVRLMPDQHCGARTAGDHHYKIKHLPLE